MNDIDPRSVAEMGDAAYLLDVREIDEYVDVRAAGAVNVPLSVLTARHEQIPRDREVYVICQSGGRSAQATAWLESQGVRAINVLGGTGAWVSAGLPAERGAA